MESHEEMYKGRRIRIEEPQESLASSEAQTKAPPPRLWIDSVPVRVLRLAGGAYISESYAYEAMPTLLELARRQVDLREPDEETTAE